MFKILCAICLSLFICGCSAFSNLPSKCDDILPGESIACDAANDIGVRIEDIGNAFILANAVCIGEGVYTKEEAIGICEDLIALAEDPITYAMLVAGIQGKLGQYPGMEDVINSYVDLLNIDKSMYEVDRQMLIGWLKDRIESMSQ